MSTATPQQIAEQRYHLANVLDAYRRLVTGELAWQRFAATPELAEQLAWKKVTEARDTLATWMGAAKPYMDAADLANEEAAYTSMVAPASAVRDRLPGWPDPDARPRY